MNLQNVAGDTALIWAAAEGRKEVVKLLLDKGADAAVHNNVWNFPEFKRKIYCFI